MTSRRMISADLFEDDFYISLDLLGRNLWVGLIARCADDQGRLQDNSVLIKSRIFPADDFTPTQIEQVLSLFATAKKIIRYIANGKNLIQIVNWWKHQTPQWASKSIYSPPPGWIDREKYHAPGNKIVTNNWDKSGGFVVTNQVSNIVTNLVTSPIKESDGDGNGEGEGEGESASDALFFSIKHAIEQKTGITTDQPEHIVKAINAMIASGCTVEDVIGGCDWLMAQDPGRPVRFYASLVKPADVERLKRIQAANKGKDKQVARNGPGKTVFEVPG